MLKTFQEAIVLTRKLSTYHIWIDSSCKVSGGRIALRAPLLPLDGMWKKCKETEDLPHCIFGKVLPELSTTKSLHVSCGPGWDQKDQWTEEDVCSCLLDDTVKLSLSLLTEGFNTPLFFVIIRTAYPWRHYQSVNGRLELQGLLLKPFEAFEEVHREPAQASEHKGTSWSAAHPPSLQYFQTTQLHTP